MQLAEPYPEEFSYRLTGMGEQKKCPKKQVKILKLASLFLNKSFMKIFKISLPSRHLPAQS